MIPLCFQNIPQAKTVIHKMPETNQTSMVAAKEQTAIAFDSLNYKHYIESISSKSKNI